MCVSMCKSIVIKHNKKLQQYDRVCIVIEHDNNQCNLSFRVCMQ